MKERVRKPVKTILIDPLVLLLFVLLLAGGVFLKAVVCLPLQDHHDVSRSDPSQDFKDARAFLFFEPADINEIGLEGLVLIPGIGQNTARKIMDYRHDFGFILDLSELAEPQGPLRSGKMPALKAFLRVK